MSLIHRNPSVAISGFRKAVDGNKFLKWNNSARRFADFLLTSALWDKLTRWRRVNTAIYGTCFAYAVLRCPKKKTPNNAIHHWFWQFRLYLGFFDTVFIFVGTGISVPCFLQHSNVTLLVTTVTVNDRYRERSLPWNPIACYEIAARPFLRRGCSHKNHMHSVINYPKIELIIQSTCMLYIGNSETLFFCKQDNNNLYNIFGYNPWWIA